MRAIPRPLVLLIFFLSGATGLIYELVWTRLLTLVFGGTTYAITTVLVAYMGGLGLGSFLAGRAARNIARPGALYGRIEMAVGLYALAVPWLFQLVEPFYRLLYPLVADAPLPLALVRFAIGACFLILPTTAMGATLPLLVQYLTRGNERVGASVGTLYGINTLGAVAGTLLAGFVLIPTLGVRATTWTASLANLLIGAVAAVWMSAPAGDITAPPPRATRESPARPTSRPPGLAAAPQLPPQTRSVLIVALALSGFCSMVYQIAWTRTLVMCFGSSTYSFTCVLAAFVMGLALGSIIAARLLARLDAPARLLPWIQAAIGVAAVCVVPAYDRIPLLVAEWVRQYAAAFDTLLMLQFAVIMAVTLLPTMLIGAFFPIVAHLLAVDHADASAATGRAYAFNTIGTIIGSFLAGFVLIRGDVLGAQWSIYLAAMINALLGVWLAVATQRSQPASLYPAAGGALIVVLIALVFNSWDVDTLAAGAFRPGNDPVERKRMHETIYYADGVDATVTVTRHRTVPGIFALTVNGKTDASSALPDMYAQMLVAHMPMLLADRVDDVCVVGLGSGVTLGATTVYEEMKRVDCIELLEEVITASQAFEQQNRGVIGRDPRVRVIRADGRNHLLLTDRRYDVIISEPSNPWIAGVSSLFTQEYFRLCRERLKPGGVVAIWTQAYAVTVENFRMIARTAARELGHITLWQMSAGDWLIIAQPDGFSMSLDRTTARIAEPRVRADLLRLAMADVERILGAYVMGGDALAAWAGEGTLHCDDNSILEFQAPRALHLALDFEIGAAVLDKLSHPLGRIIRFDESNEAHRRIRDAVSASQQARTLLFNAMRAAREGKPYGERLGLLVESLRLDPGSIQAFDQMRVVVDALEDAAATSPPTAQDRELLARANRARIPTYTYPNLIDLPNVPEFLRRRAVDEFARDRRADARQTLLDALAINPAHEGCLIELVAVTAADSPTDAAELLRREMQAGHIRPATAKSHPALAAMRELPEYRHLFGEPVATQPASNQTSTTAAPTTTATP